MTGRGARDVLEREGTVRQALTSAIRRLAFLILLGGLSVLAASGQTVTEFPLSGGAPLGIAAGPDGNMWFTESSANKIGRITPDGVITEFPIPTANSRPGGITAAADGSLWFAEGIGRIGRITTSGEVTEFPIESDPLTGLPAMQPIDIAAGPDGDLWFTGYGTSVGRMTLAGHPTAYELFYNPPIGITAGPDGNVWFTVSCCGAGASSGESSVCRITSAGITTKFGLYGQFGEPHGITTGPDGNLWFTEFSADRISRIATSGVITQFQIGGAISIGPLGIAAGPDGNLWFTESIANRIGRIDTAGVVIAEYSLPVAGSSPFGIAAGPDGNIWFTEYDGNRIGRITLPQPGSPPGRRRAVRQ